MKTFQFNKIVRDKLLKKFLGDKAIVKTHNLDEEECIRYFKEKLLEEASEINDAKTDEEIKEEIADLFEVCFALLKKIKTDVDEIKKIQKSKRLERGGFDDCVFIKDVSMNPDNPSFDYLIKNSSKYPIID